eukprot:CAMPEP_0116883578 /NCGR_PEP_ID=MMETSP0463-20121206/16113_1 /TAXON_ID=181622 /ORGANISM="Strombidinopsis sp, Strain SopsisLIS2011" /LENGTH=30 /DNA_ID= /DNA_START= /DNA_END= /DNA_ORIENTATION=
MLKKKDTRFGASRDATGTGQNSTEPKKKKI